MKKQLCTLAALFCSGLSFAQSVDRQVTGSSGGSFTGSSISVDYTVGEAVTNTGIAGTFTLSQGFQQTGDNSSSVREQLINASYRLFPNPANDRITLSVSADASYSLSISLVNATGQRIFSDEQPQLVQRQYTRSIPLTDLPAGIYFVNIGNAEGRLLQSIRFVKQ
ncbi:MAG: T9SS type A sorting domain-containing protein [Chitinophagaceae bacterium]